MENPSHFKLEQINEQIVGLPESFGRYLLMLPQAIFHILGEELYKDLINKKYIDASKLSYIQYMVLLRKPLNGYIDFKDSYLFSVEEKDHVIVSNTEAILMTMGISLNNYRSQKRNVLYAIAELSVLLSGNLDITNQEVFLTLVWHVLKAAKTVLWASYDFDSGKSEYVENSLVNREQEQ